jgi:hypothetical protein
MGVFVGALLARVRAWWTGLTPHERTQATEWGGIGIVALVLVLLIGVEHHIATVWHGRAVDADTAAANVTARTDTTHAVPGLSATDSTALHLGDSLHVVTRLVQQARQERDAADRALATSRAATAALSARVDSLHAVIASAEPVTTDSANARHATFLQRDVPYTVRADVTLPAPPAAGTLALTVALDPIRLAVHLGCGAADVVGIRAARVTVTAPAWAAVSADTVSQDPGVCNAAALTHASTAPRAEKWWHPIVALGYGTSLDRVAGRAQVTVTLHGLTWRPFGP